MKRNIAERRVEKRTVLGESIVARFGSSVVLIIDVSASGARIEHYSRLQRGAERPLRMQWDQESLGIVSRVVACKVERFIPGDEGLTVYRSGLVFDESQPEAIEAVRKILAKIQAATLVEQVANARGFWTLDKEEMPIFREGMLMTDEPHLDKRLKGLLPDRELVKQRGFFRLTLTGSRWTRKWTTDSVQPENGFTISASEPQQEIPLLCEAYLNSDEDGRDLIRKLATITTEEQKG